MITVIDYDTKKPVANAIVNLFEEFNVFIANIGFTDSSGILTLSGLTLEPGKYYFETSAPGYNELLLYPFTVTDSSPITATITFELQKGFMLPPI